MFNICEICLAKTIKKVKKYGLKKLTDEEVRVLWREDYIMTPEEIHEFRVEIVRRGFVSWEEINTKWTCEAV